MLLTFSGISAITMLVLVAYLCVHVEGAKSQKKPMSLADRRKGELHSSTISKHKPLRHNTNKLFSYGSIATPNIKPTWRSDKMPIGMSNHILKSGRMRSFVRHRRQNERSHNSNHEETVTEKVKVHKKLNKNKKRSVSNYRRSHLHNTKILNHESELQNILLLHHFMKKHRSRVNSNKVRRRRVSFGNIANDNRNRFNHEMNHNFDFFHEPAPNQFVSYSIPPIISNRRDELHSYESTIDPVETYGETGNYYYEPLPSINSEPNAYNEIEDLGTRVSSSRTNLPANVDSRLGLKHTVRRYNLLPSHDYYGQRREPAYKPLERVEYDYEPENADLVQEDNDHPLDYQEKLKESNLEQERGVIEGGNGADEEYHEEKNSGRGLHYEDGSMDPPILKSVQRDEECLDDYNEPPYYNNKLIQQQLEAHTAYVRNHKINKLLRDYQDRPAKTEPLVKTEVSGENEEIVPNRDASIKDTLPNGDENAKDSLESRDPGTNLALLNRDPNAKYNSLTSDSSTKDSVSEYEIIKYLNDTDSPSEGKSAKITGNKAREILQKILRDLQMTDDNEDSSKRDEFACKVNGSWVSEVGGIRLELGQSSNTQLEVKSFPTIPPRDNGILCKNWTLTGSVPRIGGDTGLFTITGYSLPLKKVAVFLGQCHSCGGEDMITGTWLIGKKSRNCKDTHITINEYRDVWRKEMLHNLVEKRILHKHKKQNEHPNLSAAIAAAAAEAASIAPAVAHHQQNTKLHKN